MLIDIIFLTITSFAIMSGIKFIFDDNAILIDGLWKRISMWLLIALNISLYSIMVMSIQNGFHYPTDENLAVATTVFAIILSIVVSVCYRLHRRKKNNQ